jgi:hypothetical protein
MITMYLRLISQWIYYDDAIYIVKNMRVPIKARALPQSWIVSNWMLSNVQEIQQLLTYNGIALPLLCHSLEFILMLGSHKTSDISSSRGCLKMKIKIKKKKLKKKNSRRRKN